MEYLVKFLNRVKSADKETNDIGLFACGGFVFSAEIMNYSLKDLSVDKVYTARVFFHGRQLCELFDTEQEFLMKYPKLKKDRCFPIGAHNVNPANTQWKPSALNLIYSKVFEVAHNNDKDLPNNCLLMTSDVNGVLVYQLFVYGDVLEKPVLNEDQVVSGIYWAQLEIVSENGKAN